MNKDINELNKDINIVGLHWIERWRVNNGKTSVLCYSFRNNLSY